MTKNCKMSDEYIKLENMSLCINENTKHWTICSMFEDNVHLPIIFFDSNSIDIHNIDTHAIVGKSCLAFSSNISTKATWTNNSLSMKAISTKGPLGVMFPIPDGYSINPSGYLEDANLLYTTQYHFGNHDPSIISKKLRYPYMRLYKKINNVLVSFPQTDSTFYVFYDNDEYWFNYVSDSREISFTITINPENKWIFTQYKEDPDSNYTTDISNLDLSGASVGRGTYSCDSNLINWSEMKKLFFYGMKLDNVSPDDAFLEKHYDISRNLQSELLNKNIESIILGSVAVNLHGVRMNIKDIDIAVGDKKSLSTSFDVLQKYSPEYNPEYTNNSQIRFVIDGVLITVFYYPNCPYNYIASNSDTIKGIRICSKRDLASCRLWLEWIMNTAKNNYYDVMKQKNNNRLFHMISEPSWECFVDGENIDVITEYTKRIPNLIRILDSMDDRVLSNIKVRVPEPCKCNVFEKDNTLLIPIINLGGARKIQTEILAKITKAILLTSAGCVPLEIKRGYNTSNIRIEIDDVCLLVVHYEC